MKKIVALGVAGGQPAIISLGQCPEMTSFCVSCPSMGLG